MKANDVLNDVMDDFGLNKINNHPRVKEQVISSHEVYANQRVIAELHNLYNEEEEHNDCISKELIYQRLKELKQL